MFKWLFNNKSFFENLKNWSARHERRLIVKSEKVRENILKEYVNHRACLKSLYNFVGELSHFGAATGMVRTVYQIESGNVLVYKSDKPAFIVELNRVEEVYFYIAEDMIYVVSYAFDPSCSEYVVRHAFPGGSNAYRPSEYFKYYERAVAASGPMSDKTLNEMYNLKKFLRLKNKAIKVLLKLVKKEVRLRTWRREAMLSYLCR